MPDLFARAILFSLVLSGAVAWWRHFIGRRDGLFALWAGRLVTLSLVAWALAAMWAAIKVFMMLGAGL